MKMLLIQILDLCSTIPHPKKTESPVSSADLGLYQCSLKLNVGYFDRFHTTQGGGGGGNFHITLIEV